MNDWYYSDGRQQFGPVAESELSSLEASGRIHAETLVWRAGMSGWQAYRTVRPQALPNVGLGLGDAAAAATAPVQFCSNCGQPKAPNELVMIGSSVVCLNCRDAYLQQLPSGVVPLTRSRVYAGFWIRVAAALIDGIILWFAQMLLMTPLALLMGFTSDGNPEQFPPVFWVAFAFVYLLSLGLACLYESWFVVTKGATPGKLVLSLEVIRVDGTRPPWGLAIGRHFAKYISSFTLGIGYIIVGLDAEKRGLHDMICGTRVVKKSW